ncbi:UDP-galactose-4-epimerase [Endozoicomonas montiporae]|uniref:UDP-glucose 4-epimerase n=2 Tax=Endozoicomonas montiporae TaxID=1027273 RepID=A0A081N1M3_9GAMM|nr:UDP-glucose 4-epimerase GalE [Endozoicomonas montiporae]AMO58722.1 UDP-glucose 4-epimerase/UDP-N-acetylglucosamine 4-epimerase [Endozoicomonas montiporae CL-33]KEQ12346.1 UDP-galactose-4-epimerase [Endozoicomonas montiporae]
MTKQVLVTGGAGYIGSHTCVELLTNGYQVVVLDNLCNSSREAIRRVELITDAKVTFVEGDIRDRKLLKQLFSEHRFNSVVHFAGLKAVGESTVVPLRYYDNNVSGTVTLCEEMAEQGVFNLVFSSSATVYGDPTSLPIKEDSPLGATNPYGRSKLMVEEILEDLHRSDSRWNIALLRYFNPIGAHHSGMIGEDPNDIPNNLMPYISQVAIGMRDKLSVFGGDYSTNDGTGVRDYIHVVDLAKGHVRAIEKLNTECGLKAWNLGMGEGHSVLEMIDAFEQASDQTVPYQIVDRRPGDIAACWADASLAERELGWVAEKSLQDMMIDTWRWQSNNPQGYAVAHSS